MAGSLGADGRIWKACRFCTLAIWRYPHGQMWRTFDMDSTCPQSPVTVHVPEYG